MERSPAWPRALAGRSPPPLDTAVVRLGVDGRPNAGEVTRLEEFGPAYIEPGRANLDGDRPGGSGEDERGGGVAPVNFFCVRVSEKIA